MALTGWKMQALGGRSTTDSNTFRNGGAGTIYLKAAGSENGSIIVDNGGTESSTVTPVPFVGTGLIAAVDMISSSITDNDASWQPGALKGLKFRPRKDVDRYFTVIDNTATTIFTDIAEGPLDLDATVGDSYSGIYALENLTVKGKGRLKVGDWLIVDQSIIVDGAYLEAGIIEAANVSLINNGKKVISVKGYQGPPNQNQPVQNPPVNAATKKNVKPATASLPSPGGNVFMWKAERSGRTCYLLGSIHFLNSRHYPLHPAIELAFDKSDVLAVEADISGAAGMSAATSAVHQATYQDGRTLKDEVSGKTLDMVKKKLAEINMGVDYMLKFKPWFVAMTIMQYQLAKLGYSADAGVDKYFLNKAAQKGMPVKELEGVNFQMNLFNSFSRMENEHFLLSTIISANQLHSQVTKIVNAWSAGDAQTMHRNNTNFLSQYPELLPMYKKLNDDRNVTMTQKIEMYLNSNKTHFVVVGAAHLAGPNGIVNLLRNKGYTVTQQ